MNATTVPNPAVGPNTNGDATRSKSVFVSVPAGFDAAALEAVLRRLGLQPVYADDSPVSGTMAEVLSATLPGVHLVIGVYTGGECANVVFELGFAQALGKSVLILAERGAELPTSLRSGFPVLTFPPNDLGSIRGVVGDAVEWMTNPRRSSAVAKGGPVARMPALGAAVDPLLARARTGPLDEATVYQLVGELLALYRDVPLSGNEAERRFAVWVEGLDPWMDAPLVVHTRASIRNPGDLEGEVRFVTDLIDRLGRTWGLSVAGEVPPELFASDSLRRSRVLMIGLPGLLEAVRDRPLPQVVLGLRHERAHGRG
jgi:hypothetical protein